MRSIAEILGLRKAAPNVIEPLHSTPSRGISMKDYNTFFEVHTVERPLTDQTSWSQPKIPFSRLVEIYETVVDISFGLDFLTEAIVGPRFYTVKALAASRGIELGTHASLWEFVSKLNKEHTNWDLLDQFSYAGNLYTNFYEGWLTEDYVRRGLDVVESFIARLKSLL